MHVPQNFRPVSNLSKMLKLTETAVCHQIQNHLLEHNIYPDQQSAYRKNFSTEKWFESYLENRSQRVVVNGAESRSFVIQFGLAQGSYLGPLLFTIYTGELFNII